MEYDIDSFHSSTYDRRVVSGNSVYCHSACLQRPAPGQLHTGVKGERKALISYRRLVQEVLLSCQKVSAALHREKVRWLAVYLCLDDDSIVRVRRKIHQTTLYLHLAEFALVRTATLWTTHYVFHFLLLPSFANASIRLRISSTKRESCEKK